MKAIQLLILVICVQFTHGWASQAVTQPHASSGDTQVAPVAFASRDGVASVGLDTDAGTGASPTGTRPSIDLSSARTPERAPKDEMDYEMPRTKADVLDPWEGFNRKVHSFNNVLDLLLLRPVAVGYNRITPTTVQSGVSRFFGNLRLPATAVNQALQGRPVQAGQSLGRFIVNSTAGIAGVFDPATRIGLRKQEGEDFGQTLAVWGWQESRYLVVPLLGPRTVRDTIAVTGDAVLSPIGQIDSSSVADKLQILQMIDGRAQMLSVDPQGRDSVDDYLLVRDTWVHRRQRQIEQNMYGNRLD